MVGFLLGFLLLCLTASQVKSYAPAGTPGPGPSLFGSSSIFQDSSLLNTKNGDKNSDDSGGGGDFPNIFDLFNEPMPNETMMFSTGFGDDDRKKNSSNSKHEHENDSSSSTENEFIYHLENAGSSEEDGGGSEIIYTAPTASHPLVRGDPGAAGNSKIPLRADPVTQETIKAQITQKLKSEEKRGKKDRNKEQNSRENLKGEDQVQEGSLPGRAYGKGNGYSQSGENSRKPYHFAYAVKNKYGNNFNQEETSDGNTVSGQYRVLLPDGRIQTVVYIADWKLGYNAVVTYEGAAKHEGHAVKKLEPKPLEKEVNIEKTAGPGVIRPVVTSIEIQKPAFEQPRAIGQRPYIPKIPIEKAPKLPLQVKPFRPSQGLGPNNYNHNFPTPNMAYRPGPKPVIPHFPTPGVNPFSNYPGEKGFVPMKTSFVPQGPTPVQALRPTYAPVYPPAGPPANPGYGRPGPGPGPGPPLVYAHHHYKITHPSPGGYSQVHWRQMIHSSNSGYESSSSNGNNGQEIRYANKYSSGPQQLGQSQVQPQVLIKQQNPGPGVSYGNHHQQHGDQHSFMGNSDSVRNLQGEYSGSRPYYISNPPLQGQQPLPTVSPTTMNMVPTGQEPTLGSYPDFGLPTPPYSNNAFRIPIQNPTPTPTQFPMQASINVVSAQGILRPEASSTTQGPTSIESYENISTSSEETDPTLYHGAVSNSSLVKRPKSKTKAVVRLFSSRFKAAQPQPSSSSAEDSAEASNNNPTPTHQLFLNPRKKPQNNNNNSTTFRLKGVFPPRNKTSGSVNLPNDFIAQSILAHMNSLRNGNPIPAESVVQNIVQNPYPTTVPPSPSDSELQEAVILQKDDHFVIRFARGETPIPIGRRPPPKPEDYEDAPSIESPTTLLPNINGAMNEHELYLLELPLNRTRAKFVSKSNITRASSPSPVFTRTVPKRSSVLGLGTTTTTSKPSLLPNIASIITDALTKANETLATISGENVTATHPRAYPRIKRIKLRQKVNSTKTSF